MINSKANFKLDVSALSITLTGQGANDAYYLQKAVHITRSTPKIEILTQKLTKLSCSIKFPTPVTLNSFRDWSRVGALTDDFYKTKIDSVVGYHFQVSSKRYLANIIVFRKSPTQMTSKSFSNTLSLT